MKYIQIDSVLIFSKKILSDRFFCFLIFLNYNFNLTFYFFKNKDYLIRLWVFLTFSIGITNFLNPLNI